MYAYRSNSAVLKEARNSFRAYYEFASAEESAWMDALILAWVAYNHGVNIPRSGLAPKPRVSLEVACNVAEQHFMRAREHVHTSPTYQRLVPREQKIISGVLFDVTAPTD